MSYLGTVCGLGRIPLLRMTGDPPPFHPAGEGAKAESLVLDRDSGLTTRRPWVYHPARI